MTTTARTANADQLHATVRDARDCDAINPCANCRQMTTEVKAARHEARVAVLVASLPAIVKAPSMAMFEARLTGSLNA